MADRSKFEKMLELLVNEDKEAAQELFHEIVVEKSRDIYESLLEDEEVEEVEDNDDDEVEENADEDLDEDDEDLEEGFDLDEFEVEADDDMIGGDPTDDMLGDIDIDDDGEDDMDMDMDMDDEESDDDEDEEKESFQYEAEDEDDEDDLEEAKKSKMNKKKTAGEEMREYVEKVGGDSYDAFGKMGDNGANTKSAVAGKNDMGGTAQNVLRTDTENGTEANKGALKGSALNDTSPKDMNTKNVNVPGGKAGKSMKAMPKGHGAEKKGASEKSDKSATSTLNKVSTRAK